MQLRIGCLTLLLSLTACATFAPVNNIETIDAAKAVLRWQLETKQIGAGAKIRYFVSVNGLDPPASAIAELKNAGTEFLPGSAYRAPSPPVSAANDWSISIGAPKRRPDGYYDVGWGYYCGMLCASSNVATLRRDGSGWHVVSSRQNWIS